MKDEPNLSMQRAMRKGSLHPAMAMLPREVVGLFDLMKVAEDEIELAKRGQPLDVVRRVHESFPVLSPCEELGGDCNPEVYRAHCRELLARVTEGASDADINLRTKAEVMMLLSRASLKSPLNTDGCDLYASIFREVFPDDRGIVHFEVRDQHGVDEMLTELRRGALTRKSRRA